MYPSSSSDLVARASALSFLQPRAQQFISFTQLTTYSAPDLHLSYHIFTNNSMTETRAMLAAAPAAASATSHTDATTTVGLTTVTDLTTITNTTKVEAPPEAELPTTSDKNPTPTTNVALMREWMATQATRDSRLDRILASLEHSRTDCWRRKSDDPVATARPW